MGGGQCCILLCACAAGGSVFLCVDYVCQWLCVCVCLFMCVMCEIKHMFVLASVCTELGCSFKCIKLNEWHSSHQVHVSFPLCVHTTVLVTFLHCVPCLCSNIFLAMPSVCACALYRDDLWKRVYPSGAQR